MRPQFHPFRVVRVFRGSSLRAGFTLIELLVVIVIIAVLAALTLSISGGARNRASVDRARSELAVLGTALEEYRRVHGDYPAEGAQALWVALSGNGTRRAFVDPAAFVLDDSETVLVDPWGMPYVYRPHRSGVRQGFQLYSLGPDGGEGKNANGEDMDLDNVTASL